MWNPFRKVFSKKFLGIDIGTSSVKLAEISKFGHREKLENYGQISASGFYEKPFRTFEKSTLLLSNEEVAKAIKGIAEEAGIKTKQAVFSIPDFSSFFTNFDLPSMTKEELPQAVKYEARQHIPVPLSEVVLDWQVIEKYPLNKGKTSYKILLVAVPNEIISQYQEIAKNSNLELFALEAEVFSLMRSLIRKEEKNTIAIVEIGFQSTTCTIIDNKVLKTSHSFDISDNDFTSTIARSLNIDFKKAEQIKKHIGLKKNDEDLKEILFPLIDVIVKEVKAILDNFLAQKQEKKSPFNKSQGIDKIIIAGGVALLPGLKEYFSEFFEGTEIEIGDPFSEMFYPPILEETLKEIGPSFAIAVGSALRGLQK